MSTEATTDTTSPSSSSSSKPSGRAAFVTRAEQDPTVPPEPDSDPAPSDVPTESPPAVRRSAEIRAKLEQRHDEHIRRQRDLEDRRIQQAMLERLSAQPQTQAQVDSFEEEFARDPVTALEKRKIDPTKALERLTQDALSRGSVKAEAAAEEALRTARRIEESMREQQHAERARAEQRAAADEITAERAAFAAALGDKDNYPRAARLTQRQRVDYGILEWDKYQAEEIAAGRRPTYDRDLIAARTEEALEDLEKQLGAGSTSAAATTTAATPKAKAAAKTTLTPDLAAEAAAPRQPLPLNKRRAAFIERHRQR